MTDTGKFRTLAAFATALVVSALAYNLLRDTVIAGIGDYLQRRWHYEHVIAPKGLGLHEGKYWKEMK